MKNYILSLLIVCQVLMALARENAVPDSFIYRQAGSVPLKAYVFKPAKDGKLHPAILMFHGGAWQLGDASWMFDRARELAGKGMVAIAVNYRLANNGLTPIDGVEDACAAFAWARAHAEELSIDVKRVVGYGVSAGGHLVAAAATLPEVNGNTVGANERPNAMLLYSPALNMGPDPYFIRLIGKKGNPADYSPSAFITKKLPPTMIIQGELDSIVYTKDAKDFRDKAINAGAKCTLCIYPGVGHLLTRNIKIQYKDFDPDPADAKDAHQKEDDFLASLGYINKQAQ